MTRYLPGMRWASTSFRVSVTSASKWLCDPPKHARERDVSGGGLGLVAVDGGGLENNGGGRGRRGLAAGRNDGHARRAHRPACVG
eukprot:scaffold59581_cov63-Phaeocystis_antarctica.AAC.3